MDHNNLINNSLKTIMKGGVVSLFGQISGTVFRTIFHIIIAGSIGSSMYGIYNLGFSILNIISVLSLMGINLGVIKYIATYEELGDHKNKKGVIYFSLISVSISSLFFSGLMWVFSSYLSRNVFNKPDLSVVLKIFAISLPFYSLMLVTSAIFRGLKKLQFTVFVRDLVQPVVSIFFVILFFNLLDKMVDKAVLSFLISSVIAFLAGVLLIKKNILKKLKGLNQNYNGKELIKFSLPLILLYFIILLLNKLDILMIGIFLGSSDVGVYSAAYKISHLMFIFWASINSIFTPVLVSLFTSKKMDELSYLFKISSKWVFIMTLPFVSFLFFFKSEILSVFGKEFVAGGTVLQILLLMWLIISFSGSLGNVLIMTGNQYLELLFSISALGINIILNIIFIKRFGISGVAIATFLSILIFNFIKMIFIYIKFKIHPFSRGYLRVLISIVPVLILLIVIKLNHEIHNLFYTFFYVFLVLLIYFVIIFIFALKDEEKDIIKSLYLRIRNSLSEA